MNAEEIAKLPEGDRWEAVARVDDGPADPAYVVRFLQVKRGAEVPLRAKDLPPVTAAASEETAEGWQQRVYDAIRRGVSNHQADTQYICRLLDAKTRAGVVRAPFVVGLGDEDRAIQPAAPSVGYTGAGFNVPPGYTLVPQWIAPLQAELSMMRRDLDKLQRVGATRPAGGESSEFAAFLQLMATRADRDDDDDDDDDDAIEQLAGRVLRVGEVMYGPTPAICKMQLALKAWRADQGDDATSKPAGSAPTEADARDAAVYRAFLKNAVAAGLDDAPSFVASVAASEDQAKKLIGQLVGAKS